MKRVSMWSRVAKAIVAFIGIGFLVGLLVTALVLVVKLVTWLVGFDIGWLIPAMIVAVAIVSSGLMGGLRFSRNIDPTQTDILEAIGGKSLVSRKEIGRKILESYGKTGRRWELNGHLLSQLLTELIQADKIEVRHRDTDDGLVPEYRLVAR